MSEAVKLEALFSGIRTKVDRTYTLTFGTQEIPPEAAVDLFKMNQSLCWLVVAPTKEQVEQATIPESAATPAPNRKTPSQRLRWEIELTRQASGSTMDERTYYEQVMESLIQQYREKRMELRS